MSVEIGKRLRNARVSMGLSLEDIEARTGIQKKYLLAIENGQFDLLPNPIYLRSYVRSYANTVGENPQFLLQLLPLTKSASRTEMSGTGEDSFYGRRRFSLPVTRDRQAYQENQLSSPARALSPAEGDKQGYESGRFLREESGGSRTTNGTRGVAARGVQQHYARWSQTGSIRAIKETSFEQPDPYDWEEKTRELEPLHPSTLRRPTMPPDVPDPEELGIRRSEEAPALNRRSARISQVKKDRKKSFSFGKLYTWLLIAGTILLVIATGWFMWFRMENAAKLEQKQQLAKQNQTHAEKVAVVTQKKPTLTPLTTSVYGTDRYELVNAEKLDLKIEWLKDYGSGFEIREQEVGNPVAKGEVNSTHPQFAQSFTTGIWMKLFKPNKISVNINGFSIKTDSYTNEKDIYISFVH